MPSSAEFGVQGISSSCSKLTFPFFLLEKIMSAEDISQNTQLVFHDDPLRFNCAPPNRRVGGGGDPVPKATTRELSGFIDNKLFSSSSNSAAANDRYFPSGPDFPRNMYRENRNWNGNGTSGDESDGDGDDEDDDMDDDDDDVECGRVDDSNIDENNNNNATNATGTSNATGDNVDKVIGNGNGKPKQHSSFEVMVVKDGSAGIGPTGNNMNNNAVTIAEPDGEIYYSQYLQSNEGSGGGDAKDHMGVVENCCGRKEGSSFSCESGDSLRAILSDPVTRALMDDAMILPCGHSFGAGGIQHVTRMKACYTCSQSVTEDSIAPNLSLRAAVQAFRREEELQFYRSSKRKRERFDQGGFGDSSAIDTPRGRGVQFPFAVTDRVIIKGNKRTPQRFVGREAVVTTQCLNGWYVVKTLDNAESVKLQYRSLAKVSNDASAKAMSSKLPPNWL